MGTQLSRIPLTSFEIINELCIALGAGLPGLCVLIKHGLATHQILRTFLVVSVTTTGLLLAFKTNSDLTSRPTPEKVVFITGCDSGLGYSLALHCIEMGFTVFAGCLNVDSAGALEFRRLYPKRVHILELDVTKVESVKEAIIQLHVFLEENQQHYLWALINNAGVMVFAEFEWLTERLMRNQLDVNLFGTFRVTRAFCPLLRMFKGRIINITSHCALATLPGLSVYGATKAGLSAWSDGIRVELGKYGIDVITFIPGSFTMQSNIMANHIHNTFEIQSNFTKEQLSFYGEYFKRYNLYLSILATGPKMPRKIEDPQMYRLFERALLDLRPHSTYINETFRYTFYHTLFKYSPVRLRDYFVNRFMQMPEYIRADSDESIS